MEIDRDRGVLIGGSVNTGAAKELVSPGATDRGVIPSIAIQADKEAIVASTILIQWRSLHQRDVAGCLRCSHSEQMVRTAGLEPTRLAEQDLEAVAS